MSFRNDSKLKCKARLQRFIDEGDITTEMHEQRAMCEELIAKLGVKRGKLGVKRGKRGTGLVLHT